METVTVTNTWQVWNPGLGVNQPPANAAIRGYEYYDEAGQEFTGSSEQVKAECTKVHLLQPQRSRVTANRLIIVWKFLEKDN